MLKKTLIVSTGITALALSFSLFANMPKSSGFYAEGNLGYATVAEKPSNSTKEDNTGAGINIAGGYKFNPSFAAEVGTTRYPDEEFGNSKGESNYALYLAAKPIMPFNNGFELFGKAGLAYVNHYFKGKNGYSYSGEGTNTTTSFLIGAGVGFVFTPNWEMTLQANTTFSHSDVPAMRMASIGLTYLF